MRSTPNGQLGNKNYCYMYFFPVAYDLADHLFVAFLLFSRLGCNQQHLVSAALLGHA